MGSGEKGREEIEVFKRKWLYYLLVWDVSALRLGVRAYVLRFSYYCEVGFTERLLGSAYLSFSLLATSSHMTDMAI